MKYTAIFFGLIFFTFSQAFSQDYQVSGQLKDAESGELLLYSYVHALNSADSAVAGGITDEKGFFRLRLPRGSYRFTFNQLGYLPDTTDTYSVSESIFLDVFKLKASDLALDEVVVQENSDKYYFDKDEQIVTSKMKEGAAGTYDVLSKVNGLYYDKYNNRISVDNDDNILLLVNSAEKDLDYIQSISPDRLKKVEIIRSPSGKYALEGYSAVVNIVLKDDYYGTDARYSNHSIINFILHPDNPLTISDNNISVNFSNGKYNTYANYRHFYQNFVIANTLKRYYADSSYRFMTAPEDLAPDNFHIANSDHRITAGADYYISPNHSLSYEGSYRHRPYRQNIMHRQFITESNLTGDTLFGTMEQFDEEGFRILNNSLFYKGELDSRNKIAASYAFSAHRANTRNTIRQNSHEFVNFTQDIRNYSVFNADYTHIFSDNLDAYLGYGFVWNDLQNRYSAESESVSGDEALFDYKDIRHRAFAYLTYRPSKKLVLKVGAAAENSTVTHESLNSTRQKILPHGDLSYKPFDKFQMTLKYRANSEYPSINQINPYGKYELNGIMVKGNPDLRPAVNKSISLRMNILGGLLSAEPYYIFTDDYIINEIQKTESGRYESMHQNAGLYEKKGLKANVNLPFLKHFMFQNSVDFFNLSIAYKDESKSLDEWTLSSTLIYKNPKHNTVAGFIYQNRLREYLTWDGISYGGNDFWAIMIQQPFFKQSLNLELVYILPTDFMADYNQGSYTETVHYTEYNDVRIDLLKNVFMVRLSYRFSKGQSTRKVEKTIDLDEQKGGGLF
jgi:hypothetical protein